MNTKTEKYIFIGFSEKNDKKTIAHIFFFKNTSKNNTFVDTATY